jgi:hypothetical protein
MNIWLKTDWSPSKKKPNRLEKKHSHEKWGHPLFRPLIQVDKEEYIDI